MFKEQMQWIKSIEVPVGWRRQFCGIEKIHYQGITVYFLDNEYYFKRHGSYGFRDDGERFAFLFPSRTRGFTVFRGTARILYIAMTGKQG